jgi:hypothetical protein
VLLVSLGHTFSEPLKVRIGDLNIEQHCRFTASACSE